MPGYGDEGTRSPTFEAPNSLLPPPPLTEPPAERNRQGMAERDLANEPAEPPAPTRAGKGARVLRASSERERLRTRERQAAFVAGDIAIRIEEH